MTPSACRCPRHRLRKSKSATRSWNRSACDLGAWKSCPAPRAGDVYALAEQVTAVFEGFPVPLRIAVMGCVVNGPGEAREADLGVSSGNGKGQIFVRGKVVKTVPEHQIVQALLDEAQQRDWPHPSPEK